MAADRPSGYAPSVTAGWRPKAPSAAPGTRPPPTSVDGCRRVAVDRVRPEVDGGRFPIKRTVGEPVEVTAWVHADGHDVLVVRLQHRPVGGAHHAWAEVAMEPLGSDEWRASFVVELVGTHEYTVDAWVDHFLSWRRELAIKARAGVDVSTELIEGAQLVSAAAARCPRNPRTRKAGRIQGTARVEAGPNDDREHLDAAAAMLESDADASLRVSAALDDRLLELMARHADRRLASRYARVLQVEVDRERARFGAWYEMFPRSWGPNPSRSATFGEAAAHLPSVAALGFDVVYLPPIHPIGTSFRKGRGNTLVAGPNDPGSPWAIGSPAGGHKAVEPGLGTLDDFDAFVAAARATASRRRSPRGWRRGRTAASSCISRAVACACAGGGPRYSVWEPTRP